MLRVADGLSTTPQFQYTNLKSSRGVLSDPRIAVNACTGLLLTSSFVLGKSSLDLGSGSR